VSYSHDVVFLPWYTCAITSTRPSTRRNSGEVFVLYHQYIMPLAHPIPGRFDQDPRVSFDKTAGKWQYEDEETGQEFEFNEHAKTWLPLVSPYLIH